jgi:hypothetical protein
MLLAGIITPAGAQEASYLAYGAGWFDLFAQDDQAAAADVDYRSFEELPLFDWLVFKPLAGLMVTTDGSVLGYSGVHLDIPLGARLMLTPSFAPALYFEGGGKDLGHVVEFYSRLELSYRFADASRIGISISHISNAGLDDRNPGTEIVALRYVVPVGR